MRMRKLMIGVVAFAALALQCSLALAGTGSLTVTSQPEGAEVLLNGDGIGKTPLLDKQVGEGSYRVIVRKKGFLDYEEELRVVSGGAAAVKDARLQPVPPEELALEQGWERKVKSPWMISVFHVHEGYTTWPGQNSLNVSLSAGVEKKLFGIFGLKFRYLYLPVNLNASQAAFANEKGWRVGLPLYFSTSADKGTANSESAKVTSFYVLPETGKNTIERADKVTGKNAKTVPRTLSSQSYKAVTLGMHFIDYASRDSLGVGLNLELTYAKPAPDMTNIAFGIGMLLGF